MGPQWGVTTEGIVGTSSFFSNSTGINYRSVTGQGGGRQGGNGEALGGGGGGRVGRMVWAGVDVILLAGEAEIFGVNGRNVIMR